MCVAVTFRVPPHCRVSAGLAILRKYTPVEFTIIRSRAMNLSRFPQCRAFYRAVTDNNFRIGVCVGGGGRGARERENSGYKWLQKFHSLA